MQEKSEIECSNAIGHITLECNSGHKYETKMRCRKCEECLNFRKRKWIAKLIKRWEYNGGDVKLVYLWTFGTALSRTDDNIRKIKEDWTLFRKRINSHERRGTTGLLGSKWKPLVYVIESGTKGNKLHVHCVSWGFLPHEFARTVWDDVTGQKDRNVGYSAPKQQWLDSGKYTPFWGMYYVSKYIGKDTIGWYWMGVMCKKIPKTIATCLHGYLDKTKCGDYYLMVDIEVFGQTIYDTWTKRSFAKDRGDAQKDLKKYLD